MEIMNHVESLYADLKRCEVEERQAGYIKDKIAVAFRTAIMVAEQERRENDPKLADRRMDCLLVAKDTAPINIGDSRPDPMVLIGHAEMLLKYVENGFGDIVGSNNGADPLAFLSESVKS